MRQPRGKRRRLVQLAPAQPPLDHWMTAGQFIQVQPVLIDTGLHRIVCRCGQKAQPGMIRRYAVQQRKVAAQLRAQPFTRWFQMRVCAQVMAAGGSAKGLHHEEVTANHAGVPAQPKRFGYFHAGLMDGTEHRELLLAAHAHGDR
ncbi:hypothetical protein D3C76_976430 [compost metagenome]